eukprot:scaffold2200_cov112-Cylindrotheca_fusiformis.AAC.10
MKSKLLLNAGPRPTYANIKSYLMNRRLMARVKMSERKEIMKKVNDAIENEDYFLQLMEKLRLADLSSDDHSEGTEPMSRSFSSVSGSSIASRDEEPTHHAVWVWHSGELHKEGEAEGEGEEAEAEEDPDWEDIETFFGGISIMKNDSARRVQIAEEAMIPATCA